MPEILLLRLEGPLQSWGTRSRWDVRDTQTEPTKSGVVGLLGCALGYPVGDARLVSELDAGLRFGVRIEYPGRIREDFQTITGFLPTAMGGFRHRDGTSSRAYAPERDVDLLPATIISPRFYLEDAAFLVALEATPIASPGLLAQCAAAVQSPHWPIFLGRKCCIPSRPVFESLTDEYDDLTHTLTEHSWSWDGATLAQRKPPSSPLTAYVEDAGGALSRQDRVQINVARVYGFRQARVIQDIVPPLLERRSL